MYNSIAMKMISSIDPGKYVIAVSGGVDSIALLNMLSKDKKLELVVAHFDHGIRDDSIDDRKFVQKLAKDYGLPFEYAEGHLGKKASESKARTARYDFLNTVLKKHKAAAIITAHHQDDVLETVVLNLLRGTGRKGLSSLQSKDSIVRPLLDIPKAELKDYALKNKLTWREDSTNKNPDYLRNWVRMYIVPKLSRGQKDHLLTLQKKSSSMNREVDAILDRFIGPNNALNRHAVTMLPHALAKELIAHWLRRNGVVDFDSVMVEKIVIDAKTYVAGKKTSVKKGVYALYSKKDIVLEDL